MQSGRAGLGGDALKKNTSVPELSVSGLPLATVTRKRLRFAGPRNEPTINQPFNQGSG
ncbi:unnamed protein product [Brassica rapa subsp. trilocularis]|uniref:Uncharacterized protein n=2 Tax=Brassica TaxID=3705 RepID=M4DYB3_BRACM|nr:unnamed protein product [Brassica napus]CDY51741.1 BnaA01g37240D [Brassica napus]